MSRVGKAHINSHNADRKSLIHALKQCSATVRGPGVAKADCTSQTWPISEEMWWSQKSVSKSVFGCETLSPRADTAIAQLGVRIRYRIPVD